MARFSLFALFLSLVPGLLPAATTTHYYTECTILDVAGKVIRTFPGVRCIFLDNGDVISALDDGITYFDHQMTIRWQRKLSNHHYLELSRDGKSLYLLGSSVHPLHDGGHPIQMRFDVLYKIEAATGKLQTSWDCFLHYAQLASLVGLPAKLSKLTNIARIPDDNVHPGLPVKPTHEFTHFNSIREVPPNRLDFFKTGQIILNANFLGYVIVFDHEIKQALYSIKIAEGDETHSANVTDDGNLIYFHNTHQREPVQKYSSLVEYQPVTKEYVWSFLGIEGHRPFYASSFGYVEVSGPDRILFSTRSGAYEIDRKGTVYWRFENMSDAHLTTLMPIKKGNLSEFLRNNQG